MSNERTQHTTPDERKRVYFTISKAHMRERIDVFLTRQIENATRSKVQTAIEEDRVLVNGKPIKANYKVSPGDQIEVISTRPPAPEMKPEAIPLSILYEDEALLVIDKPPGMVVHPAFGNWTGTLANALLYHTQDNGESELSDAHEDPFRPGIIHRLDKDTSGVMVAAKTNEAHHFIARQFAERKTEKEYLALVWGVPKEAHAFIETGIGRSKRDRKKMAVYPLGDLAAKDALTEYHIESIVGECSLLRLTLHTGRTHQIRVHLEHKGLPIVGDPVYGGRGMRRLSLPHSDQFVGNLLTILPRQALHAAELSFIHPVSKTRVRFTSPLPKDIEHAIEKINAAYAAYAKP